METKKVVGLWVRVSTDMQGDSPEHHRKRGEQYAELKGWEIRTVYQMEAVSGKSVANLPQFKQMQDDIRKGYISGLIFSKLARLARNTRELLDFADFFKEQNADMISLEENLDTSSPMGRFFYTLISAIAQWEREEISSRVAASIPIRAKLGKRIGGAPTFGYRWEGDKSGRRFVIDEHEGPIRKLMFEIFARTKRKQTTAAELNALGYRTRNGSLFTDTTIDRLLRDPAAKGIRRANYTKSRGSKKHWDYKPSSDWVLIECPAIVSAELWDECNQYLDAQRKKLKRVGRKSTYLLAGLVKCTCGKKMYVYHKAEVYACQNCKNRIEVADIDDIYHEQLKSFLYTEDDIESYREKAETSIAEKTVLLESTRSQVEKLEKEMNELVAMRVQKELTPDDFTRHYQPLKTRYEEVEPLMTQLQSEIDILKAQSISSGTLLEDAKDLYSMWSDLPMEDRRSIAETITDHVIVGKEEVSVKLAHLPSRQPSLQNSVTNQRINRDS